MTLPIPHRRDTLGYRFGGWLLSLCLLIPCSALAQNRVDQSDDALRGLSAAARSAVQTPAAALNHSTRTVSGGRIDTRSGVWRAVYATEHLAVPPQDPAGAARSYLSRESSRFGLDPDLEGLELDDVTHSPGGVHVSFRQTFRGLPVYLGTAKVNLDRSLQPVSAFNNTYPQVGAGGSSLNTSPTLTAEEAKRIVVTNVSSAGATAGGAALTVYPSNPVQLAWKVTAWPGDASAEWQMLVNAHDGSLITGFNRATRLHVPSTTIVPDHAEEGAISGSAVAASPALADGSGNVFNPDPLTSAGVNYGEPYVDNGDADSEALTSELFSAPLPELQERNGAFYLDGPHVRIVGRNPRYFDGSGLDSTNYDPPSEPNASGFRYTRAHEHFEAVNAYHHVDRSQRHLRSLDPGFAAEPPRPVRVNPHGQADDDNSFFFPSLNLISFGQGGVDDAEDANVIWHEYGHVILNHRARGLLNGRFGSEARSFHEGWSDYWAGSFRRQLNAAYDWRQLFPWDSGEGTFWDGRYLTKSGIYPSAMTYSNSYEDGLLWATTLMEIFAALEVRHGTAQARTISDRINVQSHYLVNSNHTSFTFRDAAAALLQAEVALYDGEYRLLLLERLDDRGLVDRSMFGPRLAFNPEAGVMYEDGRLDVEVTARANEFPIDDVELHYRLLGADDSFQSTTLAAVNDTLYTAEVAVGDQPGLIEYYFSATDAVGVPRTLPDAGAEQPYLAEVGNIDETKLLTDVRTTGPWDCQDSTCRVDTGTANGSVESIVLAPRQLAENQDVQNFFVLSHRYSLGQNTGGNVKVSTDGGRSWNVIHPLDDYPSETIDLSAFEGQSGYFDARTGGDSVRDVFELTGYAGQRIQLRIDYGASSADQEDMLWEIQQASLYEATFDEALETSLSLTLSPNYPDPFRENTTLHFTLPAEGEVSLTLYDVLGRRVRVIEGGTYAAGGHTVTIDRGTLAAGIYFLQVSTPEGRVTESVRIIR